MNSAKTVADLKHPADIIQQRDPGRLTQHPDASLIPAMAPDEYDALVEDVERRGITDPLVVASDVVLDGRHRLMAAKVVGLETVPVREFKGDRAEQRGFMLRAALLRRHLTVAQRKVLAARLIKAEPGQSDRSIAKAARISRPIVRKVRRKLEDHGQVATIATSTGADGKTYPRPVAIPDKPDTPATEIPTDYDDLFAHVDDPKMRYRLGEKLNGEKIGLDYPKGRLRAIAKQYRTTVRELKEHVAYRDEVVSCYHQLRHQARRVADDWGDLDHPVYGFGELTIGETVSIIPADQREELQAALRKGIASIEKMIEALI